MSVIALRLGGKVIKNAHASGDAVFNLIVDEAVAIIHSSIADFHASVYGAGVHDAHVLVVAANGDKGRPGNRQ